MLMNSVPNNDSEQYTESKLGWVHQVHTLNPACAHRPRALCPGQPCRSRVMGLCPVVSRLMVGHVASLVGGVASCIVTHPAPRLCARAVSRAAARVAAPSAVSWRTVAVSQGRVPGRIAALLRLLSRYNVLYCDTLL